MIKQLFNLIKNQKYNEIIKIIESNEKKNLNNKINFNYKFDNESYFIEYVIESKNIKLIKKILELNIATDIIDSNGNTILYNLIKFDSDNSNEILKLLVERKKSKTFNLKYGIDLIDKQDIQGRTCFYYCAFFNNYKAFDILIASQSNDQNFIENMINTKNRINENIILYCFTVNKLKFLFYILNKLNVISDPISLQSIYSQVNDNGENILHMSIITQSENILKFIFNLKPTKGIKMNHFTQKTFDKGYLPLHLMILNYKNFSKTIKSLEYVKKITDNSNIFEQDFFGNNVLHLSIAENNLDLFNLFLNKILSTENIGDFFNFTNLEGFTPLHLLLDSSSTSTKNHPLYLQIIKKLIENTNLNIQNIFGDTIIHTLLKKNNFIEIKDLLQNKEINLFIENKRKTTPFELIKNYNNEDSNTILNLVYNSYYNSLLKININKINKNTNLEKWEIDCVNKKKDKKYCLEKIKEICNANQDRRSIPKEKNIKFDFDSGIAINQCFFTGYQIDSLFGLLFLKSKFNIKLIINYPLTVNDELKNVYNNLGVRYVHEYNFNNIMIYWVYQKIVFPSEFEQAILEAYENKDILIIPIGIELSNGAHSNVLYIDFNENIIERFEPNGSNHPINYNYNPDLLDKILEEKIKKIINSYDKSKRSNEDIIYKNPKSFLPVIGFSILENIGSDCIKIGDPNGFCTVWCIWYCYQKLNSKDIHNENDLNLTSSNDQFVNNLIRLLKLQNINFKDLIRNFSKNISQLRDRFLEKYNLDINDWISYNYSEKTLISMEKDIISNF